MVVNEHSVVIIGGGASGIFCAFQLAVQGVQDILILERNERVGRKLSATGNGQGNISNENMSVKHFFSSDLKTVESVLARFGKNDLLVCLRRLGGLFSSDSSGRIYPTSKQATSVTDLLRFALHREGVTLHTGEYVRFAKKENHRFVVQTDKATYHSRCLVLATGGKAAPHFGSDGNGYILAKNFGHTITELRPSLVQIKTLPEEIKGLKGIRVEGRVSLLRRGKCVVAVTGDILFTDFGLSGDAIFRLSAFLQEGDYLSIDFLPAFSMEEIANAMHAKQRLDPDINAEDLFRGIINSSIGKCMAKYCANKQKNPKVVSIECLAYAIKNYSITIRGTLGFVSAQVTKGGVPLFEVDNNLMSKSVDRLFMIGELLDVDGECGGYNLQWAFSSGAVVAKAIAGRIYENR